MFVRARGSEMNVRAKTDCVSPIADIQIKTEVPD